ncbi:uncharacterized protein J3R85_018537 [Psidium guajava]|nr:uncharacterized protein J3R85_018537 [Psidium guajava]
MILLASILTSILSCRSRSGVVTPGEFVQIDGCSDEISVSWCMIPEFHCWGRHKLKSRRSSVAVMLLFYRYLTAISVSLLQNLLLIE